MSTRILSRLAALAAVPLFVGPLAAATAAEVQVLSGLQADVRVVTDRFGKAHIFAQSDADLVRVQGYIHARDRLWQMDLLRHQSQGRSAELLGPDAIPDDIAYRTFGLKEAAERNLSVFSAGATSLLQAYVDGVNAYIEWANSAGSLPPEYAELELTQVEPWTPTDSMSLGKAFQASNSLRVDLGNLELLEGYVAAGEAHDPPFEGEALFFEDLWREAPFDPASTVPDATGEQLFTVAMERPGRERLTRLAALTRRARERLGRSPRMAALMEERRPALGSNWWGVTGELSATGRPMFASDPHLPLTNPPLLITSHLVVTGDPECQQDGFYYVDDTDRIAGSAALGVGAGRRVPAEIQGTGCECLGSSLPFQALSLNLSGQGAACNVFFRGGRIDYVFVRNDTDPPFPQLVWRVTDSNGARAHDFDSRANIP